MIAALVPVKRLQEAKGRLAALLTGDERRRLALAMMEDVLRVLHAVPSIDRTAVVSPDLDALSRAEELDAAPLPEPPLCRGVNQALAHASTALAQQGADALLIVAADLPTALPADIEAILEALPARGIAVNPKDLSQNELERVTRKFVDQIHYVIGPNTDIPAPDMGTDAQVMAWIRHQYEKYHGFSPACVTGKPVELYGAEGREEATGRGVGILSVKLQGRLNHRPQDTRVAIQGFGNVGSFAASFLHEKGARIVAVGDHFGGAFNADGLDIPALLLYSSQNGGVKGFPGANPIDNEELLVSDVDVLIPAAIGGVLTAENANEVRAKYIIEAANNPTHPEADEVFAKREITVLPDILANAGGVTVSYFEWVQNRQHFKWELSRVRKELDKILLESFEKTWKIATEKKVSLRTAAYLMGIGRVGRATVLGGI